MTTDAGKAIKVWERTPVHVQSGWKWANPLWKSKGNFFHKLRMELQYVPAIPRLGTYPHFSKSVHQKYISVSMFIAILFITGKIRSHIYAARKWHD